MPGYGQARPVPVRSRQTGIGKFHARHILSFDPCESQPDSCMSSLCVLAHKSRLVGILSRSSQCHLTCWVRGKHGEFPILSGQQCTLPKTLYDQRAVHVDRKSPSTSLRLPGPVRGSKEAGERGGGGIASVVHRHRQEAPASWLKETSWAALKLKIEILAGKPEVPKPCGLSTGQRDVGQAENCEELGASLVSARASDVENG